jgi:hypothetical protein
LAAVDKYWANWSNKGLNKAFFCYINTYIPPLTNGIGWDNIKYKWLIVDKSGDKWRTDWFKPLFWLKGVF